MPQPYKLFTIYAREDAQYLEELRGQLRPLEHAGRIKVWSDREINPGVDWEKEIVQNLDTADIILILVSAAYYNSAYIHEKEIKYAITRHERGEAKVLPVIVRPCSFLDDPVISRLQVLPTDGKPVTSHHWRERDDAWVDVVAGVKRTVGIMRDEENRREKADRDAAERERMDLEKRKQEEEKVRLDALSLEEQRVKMEQLRLKHEAEDRQKEERRRAEQTAWQQAADAQDLPVYEHYLARYPQGEYAREARFRIKELKRKNAAPLPLRRYAAIGAGALSLLLILWLLFGGKGEQTAQNQSVQQDSTQLSGNSQLSESSPSDNFKNDTFTASQPVQVEKPTETKTSSSLSSNEIEKTNKLPSTISFNYPMVHVAGGTFTMGSPEGEEGRYDNECQHPVTVGSFGIGKYEVTQAQWKAIMGKNPSKFAGCDNCPVEQVSWNDIQVFIKKLNAVTSKKYRLPTEVEWEYAARGGNAGSNTYFSYSGGNNLDAVAWHDGNSGGNIHPLGTKKANQLGLHDMSGNVWEWCQDTWKAYPCDNKTTANGRFRVYRGGSWGDTAPGCRAAIRYHRVAAFRYRVLGFRLVSVSLQLTGGPDGIH